MTVNKLTTPPTAQEQINKINEIIDAIPTDTSDLSNGANFLVNNAASSTNGVAVKGSGSVQSTQIGALGSAVSMSTSVGFSAYATGSQSITIGHGAQASASKSYAFGEQAKSTAIGAFQFGQATNSEAGSVYFGLTTDGSTTTNYKLLGSDGKIPTDRINVVTAISSSSTDAQIPSAKCVYDAIQSGGGGGGGSTRNIGEIVASTIPLTDAGLHLLDGALINGSGIYSDFVDYIADLYTANPNASYFAQADGVSWTQPVLSANGTLGGDSFAVSVTNIHEGSAYYLFDNNSSTQVQCRVASGTVTWYSPTPLNITQIKITGHTTDSNWWVQNCTFYGSNDGSTWTSISTYSSAFQSVIWDTSNNSYYKYFKIDWNRSGSYGLLWYSIELTATQQSSSAEQWWQDQIMRYGVCGKFVYDSVNNTVRLPKYSNKIYTSSFANTVPVKGNGITLGLSTGSRGIGLVADGSGYLRSDASGSYGVPYGSYPSYGTIPSNLSLGVTTDSTKSGIIADIANITTSLDGYWYIVIATSTKTDIQVDIDEIATDLNGKADIDLNNCTKPHITDTYVNGTSWYRVYSDGWCEQGGNVTTQGSVTLLKPYKDTSYNVCCGNSYTTSSTNTNSLLWSKQSSSSIYFASYPSFGNEGADWQASGYIR